MKMTETEMLLRLAQLEEVFLKEPDGGAFIVYEAPVPNSEYAVAVRFSWDAGMVVHSVVATKAVGIDGDCEITRLQHKLSLMGACRLFLDWYETYSDLPKGE